MNAAAPSAFRVLSAACRRALQWRLLVLWLLAQALPLVLSILPLWAALSATLDHSPLALRLVEGFDSSVYFEAWSSLGRDSRAPIPVGAALVLALFLPWLSGTLLTAASSPRRLSFATLVHSGLARYWRMTRLWLWALVVLGLAVLAGAGLLSVANARAGKLPLEADADRLLLAAYSGAGLLFLIAQATLDAARAQLVLEPARTSVLRAWGRGCARLARQPLALLLYAVISIIGVSAAGLFAYARLRVPANGALGMSGALLLGEACAASLVWMRCARVFALVGVESRRSTDVAP